MLTGESLAVALHPAFCHFLYYLQMYFSDDGRASEILQQRLREAVEGRRGMNGDSRLGHFLHFNSLWVSGKNFLYIYKYTGIQIKSKITEVSDHKNILPLEKVPKCLCLLAGVKGASSCLEPMILQNTQNYKKKGK